MEQPRDRKIIDIFAAAAQEAKLSDAWHDRVADFIDPADGQPDVSAFLERAHRFLPIPIVVTGVAVFLAFVALALILGGIRSSRAKRRDRGTRRRPKDAGLAPEGAEEGDSHTAASDDLPAPEDDEQVLIGAGTRSD